MDKIDLKLISLLQNNARTPLKQLAAKVFLSSPATAVRIEKLENEGIIMAFRREESPFKSFNVELNGEYTFTNMDTGEESSGDSIEIVLNEKRSCTIIKYFAK